jgi:hypothetical protein
MGHVPFYKVPQACGTVKIIGVKTVFERMVCVENESTAMLKVSYSYAD